MYDKSLFRSNGASGSTRSVTPDLSLTVAGNLMESAEMAKPLRGHVKAVLESYFNDLDGQLPSDLYEMVMQEVEQPLFEAVMKFARGNQSRAAEILGINRGTLRKKLKQYDLA